MNMHDEQRLELLMTRRLDGEASRAESEELDRLLAESADARSMLEDYARIELLAGEVIREAVGAGASLRDGGQMAGSEFVGAGFVGVVDGVSGAGSSRGVGWSKWWTLPAAMAACLAAVLFIPREMSAPSRQTDGLVSPTPWPGGGDAVMTGPSTMSVPISHPAAAPAPSVVNRQRDRELIGVMTDDDSLYLLDVRRTVTLETPRNKDNIVLIGDPM